MNANRLAVALLAGVTAAGCASATQSGTTARPAATSDSLAILEAARSFSAAYMRGDAPAMAALYTDGAAIFPEGAAAIEGRPAIERYWTLAPGRRVTNHVLTPDRIEIRDDVALDYGRFTSSGVDNGRPWGPGFGRYLVVWKKGDDGRWRMHLDMWNRAPNPAVSPSATPNR